MFKLHNVQCIHVHEQSYLGFRTDVRRGSAFCKRTHTAGIYMYVWRDPQASVQSDKEEEKGVCAERRTTI